MWICIVTWHRFDAICSSCPNLGVGWIQTGNLLQGRHDTTRGHQWPHLYTAYTRLTTSKTNVKFLLNNVSEFRNRNTVVIRCIPQALTDLTGFFMTWLSTVEVSYVLFNRVFQRTKMNWKKITFLTVHEVDPEFFHQILIWFGWFLNQSNYF